MNGLPGDRWVYTGLLLSMVLVTVGFSLYVWAEKHDWWVHLMMFVGWVIAVPTGCALMIECMKFVQDWKAREEEGPDQ